MSTTWMIETVQMLLADGAITKERGLELLSEPMPKDPAKAPKASLEERARAWLVDGPYPTDLESCVKRLAAEFAEVEMQGFQRGYEDGTPPAAKPEHCLHPPDFPHIPECWAGHDLSAWLPKSRESGRTFLGVDPGADGGHFALMRKDGDHLTLLETGRFPIVSVPWADGVNQFPAPKTCTCGAAKTGTLPHSAWCDAT